MSRILKVLVPVVLIGLLGSSLDAAPAVDELWYVHYDRGLKAIERSDWQTAIVELEQAFEKNDKSSVNARTYGMRFIKYFPHYYLGVAYYNLGEVDRATVFLRQEKAAGQIAKSAPHQEQLAVLLAASGGPVGSQQAIAAAEAKQQDELNERLQRGISLYEEGEHDGALAELSAVLALDPGNETATRYGQMAQERALEAELARYKVASPTVVAASAPAPAAPATKMTPVQVPPAPEADPQPTAPAVPQTAAAAPQPEPTAPTSQAAAAPTTALTETPTAAPSEPPSTAPTEVSTTAPSETLATALSETPAAESAAPDAPAEQTTRDAQSTSSPTAILESVAWSILNDGRELFEAGQHEAALAKFNTVITLAEQGLPSTQVVKEARRYRDAADAEIQRVSEARRQAEIAAASSVAKDPPKIALVTPTNFEDPFASEIIRLQGTAVDNNGISAVEIEVNGRRYNAPQTGTRGIKVTVRPGGGGGTQMDNQGTIVNFYQDVFLTQPKNEVVIRARNINNQVTEERFEVELDAKKSQVWAAVIGIGNYQHDGVTDLDYTVADAEAFYKYLIEDLGVPEENVFKLIDSEATTQQMKTILGNELRKKAGKDDMVIIYYAGHGGPEVDASSPNGDGMAKYLLSVEADPTNLYGTAFSMNEVATIFGRLQADRVVFIADACYSGASGGRTFGTGGTRNAITDSFLDRISSSGTGRVILTASSANELSLERSDLGHGVFTYFLLEGLRGPADANKDGVITVDETYRYVSIKVPEMTGQQQHPVKKGEVEGDLFLGRVNLN